MILSSCLILLIAGFYTNVSGSNLEDLRKTISRIHTETMSKPKSLFVRELGVAMLERPVESMLYAEASQMDPAVSGTKHILGHGVSAEFTKKDCFVDVCLTYRDPEADKTEELLLTRRFSLVRNRRTSSARTRKPQLHKANENPGFLMNFLTLQINTSIGAIILLALTLMIEGIDRAFILSWMSLWILVFLSALRARDAIRI
jgi:hypothetical protein